LLLSEIKISLGSYAAEKIKLGYTTAGVSGDFSNALYTAHMMVYQVGMGKSGLLGNFQQLSMLRRYGYAAEISEQTKALLDNDIQEILQSCLKEVTELLKKEELLLDRLAKELLAKEELNYDEIEAIFKEFGKARPSS
jgi:ATP-dependent Zn protease